MSLPLYFRTIRYLRPIQIYGRVARRLYSAPIDSSPPPAVRPLTGEWVEAAVKEVRMLGPARFRFLNHEREVSDAEAWNDPEAEELWLYNLHYFEDLNAKDAGTRREWHVSLLKRWIDENPALAGAGWDPYPVSRRILNWIKWALAGNELSDELRQSLATQTRYLSKRIEIHLLGNHLLANATALLFSGFFFDGEEADRWRSKAHGILTRELDEQILPDGGYFERSPMYHSIILEDLLDCINLTRAYGESDGALAMAMFDKATSMLQFLCDILHPDGEVPFFNDTALNIAASPTDLKSYAGRLDIRPRNAKSVSIAAKRDSGLWIIAESDVRMIINAGPIGPDYLPGHAQCDTLSFEMTVLGRRFIVNSGVYTYQGTERNLFRATAAHNTVRIDGEEQHEIWANFRVARRGYPVDVQARDSHGVLLFSAAHTGYQRLKGRPLHRRRISCEANTWTIEDNIEGSGIHEAESFVHLHPQARIVEAGPTTVHCLVADRAVTIETIGGETRVESGYYSPEFGKKHENKVLVMRKKGSVPFSMAYRIVVKPL